MPWPWVGSYLRRRCGRFHGQRILWPADHNVLATAPQPAARIVLEWMGVTPAAPVRVDRRDPAESSVRR